MEEADLLALLMPETEDAAETQALTNALRRKQAMGNMAILSGDRILAPFGQSQIQQAQAAQPMAARTTSLRQGAFRAALAAQEAQRKAGQAAQSREDRAALAKAQRDFQAEQGALNRGSRERAAAIMAGDKATQQQLDNEAKLRGEIGNNKVVQEAQLAGVGFDKVRNAANDPSPAGDIALVFGFMKTLDPTSAVREGEFANAQNAAGVPDRIRNAYNRVMSGERLNPTQRHEFVRSAATQFAATKQRADQIIGGYRGVAEKSGANVERVIVPGIATPDIELDTSPAPVTPGTRTPPSAGPRIISVKGMKPGQLVGSLKEGETVRVPMGGGKYQTVRKKNGKLVKVKE